jgi:hypothetical protein
MDGFALNFENEGHGTKMTTQAQENSHKAAIVAAESARQTALSVAKTSFNNTPAAYPTYAAAVRAADIANLRALIASAKANGLEGPRQALHDLTGFWE